MPHIPSLIEETGRTVCGILLLYKHEEQQEQQKLQQSGSFHNNNNNKRNNNNFADGSVPEYQQAENLILDAPIQFLSQIRGFVPSNFFAKKIHSTDVRIFASQCRALRQQQERKIRHQLAEMEEQYKNNSTNRKQKVEERKKEFETILRTKPAEILPLWLENLCRNSVSVQDMAQLVYSAREERQYFKNNNKNDIEGHQQDGNPSSSKKNNSNNNKNQQSEAEKEDDISDQELSKITATSALQVIHRAVSPLNAARSLFASLYCFILQLSSAVWSALERAHREKEMEKLASRTRSAAFGGSSSSTSVNPSARSPLSSSTTTTKLPPLVAVRARSSSSVVGMAANPSNQGNNRPETAQTTTSSTCDTNFLKNSQFELDHSRQKIEGTTTRHPRPIRTAFHKNIHDNIAAIKSDELRSHVPLVNFNSADSAAAWELAALDFSDDEYPALAQVSALQHKYGSEVLEQNFEKLVPRKVIEEAEKELDDMSSRIQLIVEEMFEFSSGFLAPAFTQCLVILKGWFRNQNITNDFGDPSNNAKEAASSTANLHDPASTAMCALLGVEPRVPGPYIVSIDGHRPVHIPHPLPSHTILVANALRHQSQMRMEKQKHQLKLQRAKNEKILELQRASMRPRNEPRPAPHVPGRSRKMEIGFLDEGDSAKTLENVLCLRYSSMTSSVLKNK